MKKLIAMLLALVMVLGLAACGGNAAPAETKAAPAETKAPATEPLPLPPLLPPRLLPITPPLRAVFTT